MLSFLRSTFELYQKNTPKSDITNDYKEMIAGFDTGVVAMVHHNIGSFGEHSKAFEPEQFQAIPLPKTEDGRYVAEGGNTINMSIFKTTKNPDELGNLLNSSTQLKAKVTGTSKSVKFLQTLMF